MRGNGRYQGPLLKETVGGGDLCECGKDQEEMLKTGSVMGS